jgi:hypothetical protein
MSNSTQVVSRIQFLQGWLTGDFSSLLVEQRIPAVWPHQHDLQLSRQAGEVRERVDESYPITLFRRKSEFVAVLSGRGSHEL